ncbi:MAG: beta-galactosidase [Lentisphaeria bacterium]|nr:beta-galactosidase [Lentisphaeria bacterium]
MVWSTVRGLGVGWFGGGAAPFEAAFDHGMTAMRILGMMALAAALAQGADNLMGNASFETLDADGGPLGWRWDGGRAGAQCAVDAEVARSGTRSLRLVNGTPAAPHVYSSLMQTVRVEPNTPYTLSCYVRTDGGGKAWIGGGEAWQWRIGFPAGTQGWQRVSGSLRTGARETSLTVRILTESPTAGLWVDDVQLEKGDGASEFVYDPPLEPGRCRLRLLPVHPGPNLVPNPSFEQVDGVRPKGWMWDQRNTDAALTIDRETVHGGSVSLKFTNGTPFGAHVYGWFGAVGNLPVKSGTPYTLSAHVRSEDTFTAWIGGGEGWTLRLRIPHTHGRWEHVTRTFTTGPEETSFPLMLVTESPTAGFWVDDLQFREGVVNLPAEVDPDNPTDFVEAGADPPAAVEHRGSPVATSWAPSRYPPAEWAFCTDLFEASGCVARGTVADGDSLEVTLEDARGTLIAREREAVPADVRLARLEFAANIGHVSSPTVAVHTRLWRGAVVAAEQRREVHLVTPARIEAQLARVEAGADRLRALVAGPGPSGAADHARVSLTVLDQFVAWAREDVRHDRPDRAWDAAVVMGDIAQRAIEAAQAIEQGRAPARPVPRYVTSPLRLEGPSFLGTTAWPDGLRETRPVFFVGYGHFSQVRQDTERFPDYGCNLIQIEFGPRGVCVAEDHCDDRAVKDFLAVCDRAAAAGVAVNLLLSPHYFPEWALAKWPHLRDCRGGFFGYCVHAPEARQVIETSLRHVIPRIRDHPALHSLCLSNEPISTELDACPQVREGWQRWLEARHGTVAALNRRWRSEHRTFADIVVPRPFPRTAAGVDFVRFNQELFAGFHAWMAEIIHEMAPNLPVHAKIMMGAHFGANPHGIWSVCPQLFGELSQIHGNDCYCMFSDHGEWTNGWQLHEMAYDFQRSTGDKAVFNSENHVITDRDHRAIPPEHLYATLWQGALHGQSATTLWVWQRTFDHASDLEGSVIHRPDAAEAVGHCALDLNRLALEMTALQRLPPAVVLFWSQASAIHDDNHWTVLRNVYRYASFLGVPLGFVTERQLETHAAGGALPHALAQGGAKVLVVPRARFGSDAVVDALRRIGEGPLRVLRVGECLTHDEYGQTRPGAPLPGHAVDGLDLPELEAFKAFREASLGWGLATPLRVLAADGMPPYGLEVRSVRLADGRRVAAVCNHRRESVEVILHADGNPTPSRDLIALKRQEPGFSVEPLRPLLLEVPPR